MGANRRSAHVKIVKKIMSINFGNGKKSRKLKEGTENMFRSVKIREEKGLWTLKWKRAENGTKERRIEGNTRLWTLWE